MSPTIPPFSTETFTIDGVDVLLLNGELDVATTPELRSVFEHISSRGVTALVVDARQLKFIDSRGLHALVDSTETLRAHNAIAVVPSDPMLRILELSALDAVVRTVDTMEDAIQLVTASAGH